MALPWAGPEGLVTLTSGGKFRWQKLISDVHILRAKNALPNEASKPVFSTTDYLMTSLPCAADQPSHCPFVSSMSFNPSPSISCRLSSGMPPHEAPIPAGYAP